MFQVAPDKKAKKMLRPRSLKEMRKRVEAFTGEFLRVMAAQAHLAVVDQIPQDDNYGTYRKSLELVKVATKGHVYGVRSLASKQAMDQIPAQQTILIIKPRRAMKGKRAKIIRVLTKFGPWTVGTLPFAPPKSEARVISKTVPPRTVKRVEQRNLRSKFRWTRALAKQGVRMKRKDRAESFKDVKAIPDTLLDALSLEFGLGGVKARPHWRPALRVVVSSAKDFLKENEVAQTLLDPKFKGWKHWPHRVATSVSENEAKSWQGFQKRLGKID